MNMGQSPIPHALKIGQCGNKFARRARYAKNIRPLAGLRRRGRHKQTPHSRHSNTKSGKQRLCEHVPSGRLAISAACRQTQTMRGMCSLANWPPASRAELEGSAFLSIGYRPPQERGKHKLCEHVPSGRLAFSFVCGTGSFCHSAIRVSPSAGVCEHVPADKLTFSFACRAGRFRVPINRVPSYQSGIRKR